MSNFDGIYTLASNFFDLHYIQGNLHVLFDVHSISLDDLDEEIDDLLNILDENYEWEKYEIKLSVSTENTIFIHVILQNFNDILDEIVEL